MRVEITKGENAQVKLIRTRGANDKKFIKVCEDLGVSEIDITMRVVLQWESFYSSKLKEV